MISTIPNRIFSLSSALDLTRICLKNVWAILPKRVSTRLSQYPAFCCDADGNWQEWLAIGSEENIHTGMVGYYPCHVSEDSEDARPIVGVDWKNVLAFCQWIRTAAGGEIRLLTGAEWEFARRAERKDETYSDLDDIAWYEENSQETTHPIGEKEPNA